MGVSREQAAENRRAIVAAADALFRERGVDGVGLTELMSHAGFTQGGFYNHFASKEALVAAVVAAAMDQAGATSTRAARRPGAGTPIQRHVDRYASAAHRDNVAGGCPVIGFAGARLGPAARTRYAAGVETMLHLVERLLADSGATAKATPLRDQAVRLFSELVGALVLARAVQPAAPELADEILAATRRGAAHKPRPRRKPARRTSV